MSLRGNGTNSCGPTGDPCDLSDVNGTDYPPRCKIKSFTTFDLSGAWQFGKNSEIFGSIQNLFDTKPPIDFLTYGAIGYNPLDYAGATGSFFRIGLTHQF